MRQAKVRAKCDKGVQQKSLKADSLFGAKEQRKPCGSILLPSMFNPVTIVSVVGVVKSFRHLNLSPWGTEIMVPRGKTTG